MDIIFTCIEPDLIYELIQAEEYRVIELFAGLLMQDEDYDNLLYYLQLDFSGRPTNYIVGSSLEKDPDEIGMNNVLATESGWTSGKLGELRAWITYCSVVSSEQFMSKQ